MQRYGNASGNVNLKISPWAAQAIPGFDLFSLIVFEASSSTRAIHTLVYGILMAFFRTGLPIQ